MTGHAIKRQLTGWECACVCGHSWLSIGEEPPDACAKCRRRNYTGTRRRRERNSLIGYRYRCPEPAVVLEAGGWAQLADGELRGANRTRVGVERALVIGLVTRKAIERAEQRTLPAGEMIR